MIEVHHVKKLLESFDCRWPGELLDSLYLGGYWGDAMFHDVMSQEVNLLLTKYALG